MITLSDRLCSDLPHTRQMRLVGSTTSGNPGWPPSPNWIISIPRVQGTIPSPGVHHRVRTRTGPGGAASRGLALVGPPAREFKLENPPRPCHDRYPSLGGHGGANLPLAQGDVNPAPVRRVSAQG